MNINERIKQSQIRVRSGLRLIGFLVLADISVYFLGIFWAVKFISAAIVFFILTTMFEVWNVRRQKRKLLSSDATIDTK